MSDPFPLHLRVEVAGYCNFKCRHCPNQNMRGLMSFTDFVRVMESMPKVPELLLLNHSGEPMLNQELEEIVAYAKKVGVRKIFLNTNASLIRPIPGLTEMWVSFDGISPEQNDYVRVGSNFEKFAPRVKEIAEQQRVVIYNTQASSGHMPKPAKYLTDYFGNSVQYFSDAMRLWAGKEGMEGSTVVQRNNQPVSCRSMFDCMHVLSDGDVVGCCEDLRAEHIYGNVFNESPVEIWKRMQPVRTDFSNKIYNEMCARCYLVNGYFYKTIPSGKNAE